MFCRLPLVQETRSLEVLAAGEKRSGYSGLVKVIAAKEHKEHKEASGFARENRSFLEIFVFLCGYSFS